jgi:hypothetical protein
VAEHAQVDKNAFLIRLSESESVALGRVEFARQPDAQKVFSAVWTLESEVNNGGFDQYLRNSDPDAIVFAPAALRAIGASTCARIVESAIEAIAPMPRTQDERYRVLDALDEAASERLEALDAKFFAYPDNLTELLFEYVRQYPADFGAVPSS